MSLAAPNCFPELAQPMWGTWCHQGERTSPAHPNNLHTVVFTFTHRAPQWAQRQQICNILHYIFPSARENSSFSVLLGIKSTISLKGRMHSWTLLSEIHPTSPVHTQAHITHNSCYCTKKPHSATPRSASKGNVNVKGKVLLVCRISIIQLEISIKVLCSLVF